MASAPYKTYLEWYHRHAASKRWATFAPSEQRVDVGDYGWFGDDLLFNTAADQKIGKQFGIAFQVSPEIAEGPSLRLDARDFRVRVDGGASLPLPLKAPLVVKAGARITLEAQKEHWFALQLRQATKAEMTNPTEVRESIRQEYLAGRWSLDDYVVIERVRCGDGFAILGEGKGTAFAFTVGASLTLLTGNELVNGSLAPEYRNSDFSYNSFVFDASDPNGQLPTPTFAAPMGIDRKRWARLLGLKRVGNVVVDASGKRWPVGKTPINLRHLTEEQRLYQPGAEGVLSPDEILAIPLDEFFETFGSLDQVFQSDTAKALEMLESRFSELARRADQLMAVAEAMASHERAAEASNENLVSVLGELVTALQHPRVVLGGPSSTDAVLAADLALPIEDLNLTVRSYNGLKREGIHTVGELVGRSEQDLLEIRNFGAKSIEEVSQKLMDIGLSLKDSPPGFDPGSAVGAYGDDDESYVETEQY